MAVGVTGRHSPGLAAGDGRQPQTTSLGGFLMATTVAPPAAGGSTLASEQEARAVAEAARETEWTHPSFVREMFLGRYRLDLIHPHPRPDPDDMIRAQPFFDRLRALLERIDSEEIDRTGQIPPEVVDELRAMGAFGIKIPAEYGGLGLSPLAYVRAMAMVTSKDGSLTAMLSASQSIGVPQPLALFGTDEQKRRFGVRADRGRCRLRSGQHDDGRGARG
jgi:hypothetical protein